MNNTQLYIPKKCKVGLQIRQGTFTGKLGYIIYHDGKVWRKETSWEGWRHKEGEMATDWDQVKREYTKSPRIGVEPIEFENVPTEGFVLNKKAGGTNSGWNHRQTYCRVYDPRGWEFEITIPNLLFLLEECSSFKGKGLEGEFIYSWDGKDLVLLPVTSSDYKLCEEYTKLQSKKVGKKDLIEGYTYLTSRQVELTYLGYYPVCTSTYDNYTDVEEELNTYRSKKSKLDKTHVFCTTKDNDDDISRYVFLNSLSTLKSKISDECHKDFANLLDGFLNSEYSSLADHVIVEPFINDKVFDGYFAFVYLFGDIKTSADLKKARKRILILGDGKYQIYKYTDNNGYYRNNENSEGIFTKEEIKKNYGQLVRVYKNGFKKLT